VDITAVITKELGIEKWQTEAVIRLIDEGNTIPFIARYRKEAHGNLSDAQLRALDERLTYLRGLEERKSAVLSAIEEQGKLTDELRGRINAAETLVQVEDLYRPYKQKRRTKAMIAKEKGLQPLADYILSPSAKTPVLKKAEDFVSAEKEVPDAESAVEMAQYIIAEQISDNAQFREWIRKETMKEGLITSAKAKSAQKSSDSKTAGKAADSASSSKKGKTATARAEKEPVNRKLQEREGVYEMYWDFSEELRKIPGYRVLALNRGEKEKFLTVHIEAPEEKITDWLYREMISTKEPVQAPKKAVHSFRDLRALSQQGPAERRIVHENPVTSEYIHAAVGYAYKKLIAPSIENEIRNDLTEKAEEGAMKVFADNLRQLLMQAPVQGKVVLGWDPAFRTGCKLAVVDKTGKVLDTAVIFPTEPQKKVAEAEKTLQKLCSEYHVDVISCGNGTASRESEQVIADFIKKSGLPLHYVIVNEAGASVYSASELATEEFPQFDVGQRSAASIARRLQDPLAELVKIDPKSIGVGQYQHDMNQTKLGETLGAVVEDCVNSVGVDVNTASAPLLSYIAGVNKTIAKNIVTYREANGRFNTRRDLLKVPKLGPKAFEQCAGFLRIRDGAEPLDRTGVHPESYDAARTLLKELGLKDADIASGKSSSIEGLLKENGYASANGMKKLSQETGLGEFTLKDVIGELEKPGRDPRSGVPGPVLRSDVLSMKDLKPGMILKGTVRNIVDFGAFVDIGVHQDGLVHISALADRFVRHPLDVVKVGDIVRVKVLGVDEKKGRISLSMKDVPQE